MIEISLSDWWTRRPLRAASITTPDTPLAEGDYQVGASGLQTLSRQPVAPFAVTFSVSWQRGDPGADVPDLDGEAERAFNSPWRTQYLNVVT